MTTAFNAAPAGMIDTSLLPPALAAKHRDLNRAGALAAVPNWRRTVGATAGLATLGAWLSAPPAAAMLIAGPSALLISALTAALLACSVVATATVRRHPRGAYTRTERRHLDAARVQWPTSRADLTRHPNAARLLHDWDSRLASDRRVSDGDAALVWAEPNLVAVAVLIADSIRDTTTWTCTQIDTHRARIDIDAAVHQIALSAYRCWRAHATNTTTADAAESTWHELVDLIDTLSDYCKALRNIDHLLMCKALLDVDGEDALVMVELGIDQLAAVPFDRNEIRADLDTQIHTALDRLARTQR
ncbi:hypothetical protein H7I77_25120 [Mycolicibacterium novocastrense]|uniref:Uncharacterized protein n=1 Tax=Mycolicibacterium novocastrense TaxID=59813 RepID=A0AAW5STX6_MYCNV|nr:MULTISPECIES: hypothetical protein [Mycolicibacterium]MCV7026593.1 hypothetical protein [Mycolicibacterium novocastrense]MDX1887464.1 hypothetical protein [Mycolicibacterium sp. 120270]GAT07657.1 uncharacterized protein RMCN_0790 [Mycolicibacterium novocastrense]